jgi:hypothetical protein
VQEHLMTTCYDDGERPAEGGGLPDAVEAVEAIAQALGDCALTRGPRPILEVAVGSVVGAVPRARSASVLLLDRWGQAAGGSTSDQAAAMLDEAQVALGEGPAIDAAMAPGITQEDDLRHSTRWPRWTGLALDAGRGSLLSAPLRTRRVRGAVTLYGDAGAFGHHDVMAARLVASAVAMAVDHVLTVCGLTRALETRDVIGQAKGILQERFSLDDRAAFALLVESSQHANIKLREVAALLADGTLAPPRRS